MLGVQGSGGSAFLGSRLSEYKACGIACGMDSEYKACGIACGMELFGFQGLRALGFKVSGFGGRGGRGTLNPNLNEFVFIAPMPWL